MREPPKLTPPMVGEEIGSHLRKFCKEMQELTAWIKEAVEIVEARSAPVDHGLDEHARALLSFGQQFRKDQD